MSYIVYDFMRFEFDFCWKFTNLFSCELQTTFKKISYVFNWMNIKRIEKSFNDENVVFIFIFLRHFWNFLMWFDIVFNKSNFFVWITTLHLFVKWIYQKHLYFVDVFFICDVIVSTQKLYVVFFENLIYRFSLFSIFVVFDVLSFTFDVKSINFCVDFLHFVKNIYVFAKRISFIVYFFQVSVSIISAFLRFWIIFSRIFWFSTVLIASLSFFFFWIFAFQLW